MTLPIQLAESRLLLPAGLDAGGLERTFGTLLGPGIDFGDLYFQHARRESWTVEDGIVKDGAHSIEQGVGVRAISGEKTGFAYSDEINTRGAARRRRSRRARSRATARRRSTRALVRGRRPRLYPAEDPIDALGNEDKVEALRRIDKLLRAADPRVQQVMVSLSGGVDTVLVARSDGVLAADVRPLVRFNVQVIVEQNGRRESGYAGGGGRYSLRRTARRRQARRLGARSVAPGAGEPRSDRCAGRRDAGGARQRLARRAAARGGRPRPRRRLQPQGHVDVRRPHGPARGLAGRDHRRRRHAAGTPRLAQRRRRRHADAVHDADRGRRAGRLHAGHAQRAPDGHGSRPATAAANRSRTCRCRA